MPPLLRGVRRLPLPVRCDYRSPMPSPPSEPCEPSDDQRRDADADRVQRKDLSVSGQRQRPEPATSTMTTVTDNLLRRTANPMTVPTILPTRFKTCMSSPPLLPAPRGIRSAGNLVLLRRVRSPTRRMPSECGCVENAPTATGESRDGVREKGRSSAWGQRGRQGAATGKSESTGCQSQSELGEYDESCQCRHVRPGELRRWGSDRTATTSSLFRRVCEEPALRPMFSRAAGMRKRTERQSTPTEGSRHSRRGQESNAQSVDRVTQREGACIPVGRPFGEQRSILGGRFPGPGCTLQVSRAGNAGKA